MTRIFTAPAKVIISGEHAVVYGKPALVAAIDFRLQCQVRPSTKPSPDGKQIQIIQTVKDYLSSHHIPYKDTQISLRIRSDIPLGRGLGSSAALSVAAVAACLDYFAPGREFSRETINSIAYKVEKLFHKNPSGVDNSASCMGGLIFYRKEFEFLKLISALPFKLPATIEQDLYLIDSGKPSESTADMVNLVGDRYNADPTGTEAILARIEKVTKRLVVSVVSENRQFFEKCITENEQLLEDIGVVSPKAVSLISTLKQYGKGKITGAGGKKNGSGFILFLADRGKGADLEAYLTSQRIKHLKFRQDYAGLKPL